MKIRALQFIDCDEFVGEYNYVLQPIELYNRVNGRIDRSSVTFINISKRACTALANRINTLWEAAKGDWVSENPTKLQTGSKSHNLNSDATKWVHGRERSMLTATNKCFTDRITEKNNNADSQSPTVLKIKNTKIYIYWKRERAFFSRLTPKRRILLFCMIRNTLPLGYKRRLPENLPILPAAPARNSHAPFLVIHVRRTYMEADHTALARLDKSPNRIDRRGSRHRYARKGTKT